MKKPVIRWALCLFVSLTAAAEAAPPTTRPDRRVLIVSVDGMRPDLMLRGDTPNMHRLLTEGAFTLWAQTTAVSVTIPSHVSMLTGARPQIHQIEWNHDIPLSTPLYPTVPTIFEVAHKAGYTTGIVAGKSKFDVLLKPGTLDVSWVPDTEIVSNREVLGHALKMINDSAPQVLVVHFPESDRAGHAIGWGSPQQLEAIHNADSALGTILGTLASRGLLDQTMVILTADHGGAGKRHGPDDPRSRSIPWICVGPGVRKGIDLTNTAADRTVRTEDTFATACYFLGLPVDPALDGRPVMEAFDRSGEELLTDATPAPAPAVAATPKPAAPPATRPAADASATLPTTQPTPVAAIR